MPREAAAQAARGPSEPTVAREERRDRLSPRFSRLRKRIVRQLRERERALFVRQRTHTVVGRHVQQPVRRKFPFRHEAVANGQRRKLRVGERLTAASSSSSWSRIFQSRANVSCTISQASA